MDDINKYFDIKLATVIRDKEEGLFLTKVLHEKFKYFWLNNQQPI